MILKKKIDCNNASKFKRISKTEKSLKRKWKTEKYRENNGVGCPVGVKVTSIRAD